MSIQATITTYQNDTDFIVGGLIEIRGWSHKSETVAHSQKMNHVTFKAYFTGRNSQPSLDTDLRKIAGFGERFKVEGYKTI